MNFTQRMRQVWIDATLSESGELNRANLCEAFGISVPQASVDLRTYRETHPEKIEYDPSDRIYRRRGDAPAFDAETRTAVLAAQRAVGAV